MVRGNCFHIIPRMKLFFLGRICSLDIIEALGGSLLGIFLFELYFKGLGSELVY